MYAGRIVESGPVRALFKTPRHPYTEALMASAPRMEGPYLSPGTDTPPNSTSRTVRNR